MASTVSSQQRSEKTNNARHLSRVAAPYVAAVLVVAVFCTYLAAFGHRYGLDLRVYRSAAQAFLQSRDPYHLEFTVHHLPFTYPPFALAFLSPFTWASFAVTQWLLWMIDVVVVTAAIVIVLSDRGVAVRGPVWCGALVWAVVAMMIVEPARSGIDYGQIECLLMILVVLDALVVPPPFRGTLIGVAAAVKLTPLIFLLLFLVRRDWWSAVRAVLSFALLTGLAWLLWPHLSRTFWFHDANSPTRTGPIGYPSNQNWYAILHRHPFPAGGSAPAWLLLSLLTILAGTFIAWRCVHSQRQSLALISIALAGLMVSPISWSHHWIWVVLIPPALVVPRRHDTARVVRIMLWGIVAITIAAPYWWVSSGAGADTLEAVLPLWTFATLLTWSSVEYVRWGGRDRSPLPDAATALTAPVPDR
jgi:alpha-1,2-mannosyltransferase